MGVFGAPRPAARCTECTRLTYPELLFFFETTGDGETERQRCALQRGHPGAHTAGIAKHETGAEGAWWLQWDSGGHHCIELAHCTAYRAAHPDYDICQLPAGHWGYHSWLLTD
ncbi:hypothetical protein [Catellatospora sp. NPDC049609]|uniref:hypothetical protein n=1 Tax=Catellatospora sp. NPDC049609 TaxID=3155505 RepID=UPI00341B0A10